MMISLFRSSVFIAVPLILCSWFTASDRAHAQTISIRDVQILHAQADQVMEAGNHDNARERYKVLIGYRMRKEGAKAYGIAAISNSFGVMQYKDGDFAKANEEFEKAISVLKAINAKDHPSMATALCNLGFSRIANGDNENAMELFEDALKTRLRRLGQTHPEVADCHEGLGLCFSAKNEADKARDAFQKCLDIRVKAFGEEHVETAAAYMGLSMAYLGKNDFAKADQFDSKAREILKKTGGVAPVVNRNPVSRLKIPHPRFFKVHSKLKRKP